MASGHTIRLPGGFRINRAGKLEKNPFRGMDVSRKLKAKPGKKVKVARPTSRMPGCKFPQCSCNPRFKVCENRESD